MTHFSKKALLCLFVGGCAIHPLPEDISRKSTFEIVRAIRCEAKQAVLDINDVRYDQAVIGYAFTFDITEHDDATADATFKRPFFSGGAFDLSISAAGSKLTREAKRTFTVSDTFAELKKAKCDAESLRIAGKFPITGSIGLKEVIQTFVKIEELTGLNSTSDSFTPAAANTTAFSDDLKFKTELMTGGIKPQLTLNEVPGVFRLTQISANLSADRTDEHNVILALALPNLPAKQPNKTVSRAEIRNLSARAPISSRVPTKAEIDSVNDARTKVFLTLDRKRLFQLDQDLANALRGR